MRSRWKLGRVAAAAAVAASLIGVAALPASAAEPAKGNLTGDKTEGVGVYLDNWSGKNPMQASLLHFKLTDGSMLKVYCVEIKVDATEDDMVEAPWDSYPKADSPFHANSGKINWVLQHGFPANDIETLQALELDWNADDPLEVHEAVSATQAAVWHFSDGVDLRVGKESDREDANKDIRALYDYLVDNAKDTEPAPVLNIDPAELEGEVGGMVGPFTVTSSGKITELGSDLPEGVTVVDADGNELTAEDIADGTEIFLKVPGDAAAGEGTFNLANIVHLKVGRLFIAENYATKPSQSLIVAASEKGALKAEAKGIWKVAPPTTTTPTTTPPSETTAPPVTTTPTPVPPGEEDLPDTGTSVLVPALVGLGLVGAGATALILLRRRRVTD